MPLVLNGLDVLGVNVPPPGSPSLRWRTVAAIAGGAIGLLGWRRHRVLGALGGLALGRNGYAFVKKEISWREAAESLVPHGAAIAGSLSFQSHPAIAYVGFGVLASAAIEAARGKLGERVREIIPHGLLEEKAA